MLDKRKIVHSAREKIRGQENYSSEHNSDSGGLMDMVNTFMDIVGGESNDSNGDESGRKGKTSGRKPQVQGRVASVGSRVADQLKKN